MKRIAVLAVLAFLLFSAGVFGQTESSDDPALKTLVRKLTDAQLAFDAPALDQMFTPDYIEISPAGEFDPRAKVLGFYKPGSKPGGGPVMSVDLSEFSIRNYGKLAVVIVKITFTATVDGKPMPPRSMRATFVCRSETGKWKIASAQYTGVRQLKPQ